MKIISIIGARPQFIKISPICKAVKKYASVKHVIIHTGQHYDYCLSKIFFDELGISRPDYNLEVGSGTHGYQTGEIIKRAEKLLIKERPDWVIVYGDTNSTLAGALAAAKLNIPLAHVEAGLRCGNKTVPEEINRIMADHISRVLFCPTHKAVINLKKEGFCEALNDGKQINNFPKSLFRDKKLPLVINSGDIMLESVNQCMKIANRKSNILKRLKLKSKEYYMATVHRAENTDNKKNLSEIMAAFALLQGSVIFPAHPRTQKMIKKFAINLGRNIRMLDPVSYFDMLTLEKNAYRILTDSGGIQKEAYWFGVPCITLREETEWLETVESGRNIIVGSDKSRILNAAEEERKTKPNFGCYGDGNASKKIIKILLGLHLGA